MKKIISLLLVFATVLGMLAFSGCDGEKTPSSTETLTLEAGSATEGTGGPFSPEDHPILKGGVDENFPEFVRNFSGGTALGYFPMQIYNGWAICGFSYFNLSDPGETLYPIFFDGFAALNESYSAGDSASCYGFLIDPVLTAENGGVPVIHYNVMFTFYNDDNGTRTILSKAKVFTFNVKTQEITAVFFEKEALTIQNAAPAPGEIMVGTKINTPQFVSNMALYRDHLYYNVYDVSGDESFYCVGNDGKNAKKLELQREEEESKEHYFLAVYEDRIWAICFGKLCSFALDLSDFRLEKQLYSEKHLYSEKAGIFDGYVYYTKNNKSVFLDDMEFGVTDYVRSPLSNLETEETLLEQVVLYSHIGDRYTTSKAGKIFFTAKEDVFSPSPNALRSQRLCLYDCKTNEIRPFYTQKKEDSMDFSMRYISDQWVAVDFTDPKNYQTIRTLFHLESGEEIALNGLDFKKGFYL